MLETDEKQTNQPTNKNKPKSQQRARKHKKNHRKILEFYLQTDKISKIKNPMMGSAAKESVNLKTE